MKWAEKKLTEYLSTLGYRTGIFYCLYNRIGVCAIDRSIQRVFSAAVYRPKYTAAGTTPRSASERLNSLMMSCTVASRPSVAMKPRSRFRPQS
jgi:hypothetical protein